MRLRSSPSSPPNGLMLTPIWHCPTASGSREASSPRHRDGCTNRPGRTVSLQSLRHYALPDPVALAARQSPGAPNGALLRAAYANDPDATIGYISLSKELNGFIGLVQVSLGTWTGYDAYKTDADADRDQGTADADTFLAPTTLPVTGTSLPIISVDYGSGYFLYTQPDELDGETCVSFLFILMIRG